MCDQSIRRQIKNCALFISVITKFERDDLREFI